MCERASAICLIRCSQAEVIEQTALFPEISADLSGHSGNKPQGHREVLMRHSHAHTESVTCCLAVGFVLVEEQIYGKAVNRL